MVGISKVETDKAPDAIGPYSQGVVAGDYLFVSGQIAIDPKTGELVEGEIKEQTTQVLKNLEAVLGAHGIRFDRVVKTEVFLADMEDFGVMNEVYASYFSQDIEPARQAVEVPRLPKSVDVLVEISCIAYLGL